ncbi:MAG: hypothetical protein ACI9C4_002259 [Paraglaciecola sp.]
MTDFISKRYLRLKLFLAEFGLKKSSPIDLAYSKLT